MAQYTTDVKPISFLKGSPYSRPYCAGCPKADERKQANPCEYCELEVLAGEVPGELPDEKRNELRWVTSTSLDGQPFLDSFAR